MRRHASPLVVIQSVDIVANIHEIVQQLDGGAVHKLFLNKLVDPFTGS